MDVERKLSRLAHPCKFHHKASNLHSNATSDLKKILQERGLVISGNKADLIARLQEDDKKAGGGAAAGKHTPTHHLHARAFALTFSLVPPMCLFCDRLLNSL
jgi:hypothetical protein